MFFRKMNVALLALCMSATVAVGCSDDPDPGQSTDMSGGVDTDMGGGGTQDMNGGGGGEEDMSGGGGEEDMTGGGEEDMNGGGTDDMTGGGEEDMNGGETDDMGDEDMTDPGVCGDGMVSGDELCDGQTCPTSVLECDDSDQCTADSISGSAANCDAQCVNEIITACDGGQSDGCCPAGCTAATDADCSQMGGAGDTGAACDADGDCTDGVCVTPDLQAEFTGGYCTNLGCQTDGDCSGDGSCEQIDGGSACFDTCNTDADCRTSEGYVCNTNTFDTSVCVPGGGNGTPGNGDAGGACMTDADCGPAGYGFCITEAIDPEFTGGYCATAIDCSTGTCGGDNICIPLFQDGTTACIDGCTTDTDCRTGYSCQDISQNGSGVLSCLPAPAPVTGETGIACTSDMDCDAAEICIGEDDGFPGGYCSRQCQSDAECPTGSLCSSFGVCSDSCDTATPDCRAGYLCGDADQNGSDECWPGSSGSGAVGTTCMDTNECAGGFDAFCIDDAASGWSDGYCTQSCTSNSDCTMGSHCGFFNQNGEGVCLSDCTADTDCRGGTSTYFCGDADGDSVAECAPGGSGSGQIGEGCATLADCAGGAGALCISEDQGFLGGYCSDQCTSDSDCATGSHCSAQFGVCVEDCTMDSDCRMGYICDDGDGAAPNECWPGSNGTGAPGAACATTADCAGRLDALCADDAQGFPGGYCLQNCSDVGDMCPADSLCVPLSQDGSFSGCVDTCMSDADCRTPDYTCQDFGLGQNICWLAP